MRIWVPRDGLFHLLREDGAKLLIVLCEQDDPQNRGGQESKDTRERADAHAHARSYDHAGDTPLIQPDRQSTGAEQPETATESHDRNARKNGRDETGEYRPLGSEAPLNRIGLVRRCRWWPRTRIHLRSCRVWRLRRVFLGNGDANLRSTAMGTKGEGLVNGSLALVAEVVHDGEGNRLRRSVASR